MARGSIPILLPGYLGNETYRMFLEEMIRQGGRVNYDLVWITQNQSFFLAVPLILTVMQLFLSFHKLEKNEKGATAYDYY